MEKVGMIGGPVARARAAAAIALLLLAMASACSDSTSRADPVSPTVSESTPSASSTSSPSSDPSQVVDPEHAVEAPGRFNGRLYAADMLVYGKDSMSPSTVGEIRRLQGVQQVDSAVDGRCGHREPGTHRGCRRPRQLPPLHALQQRQHRRGLGSGCRRGGRGAPGVARQAPARCRRIPEDGQQRRRALGACRRVRAAGLHRDRRRGQREVGVGAGLETQQCPADLDRTEVAAVAPQVDREDSRRRRLGAAPRRGCPLSASTPASSRPRS